MAADPPEAGSEQEALSRIAGLGEVARADDPWWHAPYPATAVRGAHVLPLPIGKVGRHHARRAQGDNGDGQWDTEVARVIDQIEGGGGIDTREPYETSPADIEARAIVDDIESPQITGFPAEKLRDIEEPALRRPASNR